MKWISKAGVVAGGVLLAAGLVGAQVPGAPAVPGLPAPPAVPGAPGAAAAAEIKPGFFGKMCVSLEACRRKLCAGPAGLMLNNMTKPLTFATGGIFPPFCPVVPNQKDLEKPGVAGASDAIKKDALEAKMRQEKVRFLATVDCRYYPDASPALVAALRTDGSECVRYEAALALGRGCCCNQLTIDALEVTVAGSEKDGNPAERSVRVRCAAALALERCLACYVAPVEEVEPEAPKPEPKDNVEAAPSPVEAGGKTPDTAPAPKPADKKPDTTKAESKKVPPPGSRMPSRKSVETARRTLNEFNTLLAASRQQTTASAASKDSIYNIIRASAEVPAGPTPMAARQAFQPSAAPAFQPMASMTRTMFPASSPAAAASRMNPTPPPAGRVTLGQPMPEASDPLAASVVTKLTPPPAVEAPVMPATPMAPSGPVAPAAATQPELSPAANPLAPVISQLMRGEAVMDRHAAIRQLVKFDWQKNPVVLSALLSAAKNDTVPAVRVDCLRHLAAYGMVHPQVLAEVGTLTRDADAWVRDEAVKALTQLKSGQ